MSLAGGYPIPARVARSEEVIQRSRFLTLLAHSPTSEAAHSFLHTVREEYPDASTRRVSKASKRNRR